MAFKRLRGKTKLMYFEGDTAQEVRDGGLVQLNDSGLVEPVTNDTSSRPLGVCRRNDTVTDSALVPVEVPVEDFVEWLVDTDSDAGLVDSDIGRYCAVDTAGGGSVNAGDSCGTRIDRDDTAVRTVFIARRVSASQAVVVLARRASLVPGDTAIAA